MTYDPGIIKIKDGETISITRDETKKKYFSTTTYDRVGKKGTTRWGVEGMDMARILKNLNVSGNWLFWTLVEKRNERTNVAVLKSADLTPVERKKVSKGYKELHENNIVVRVKQNHYLINPKAVLPVSKDYADVWNYWEEVA